jgi:hypothetical protein
VALEQEARRVARARDQVGEYLDDIEQRFSPGHLAKVGSALVRASATRHPVVWAVSAAVGLGVVAGIVTWALMSDEGDSKDS